MRSHDGLLLPSLALSTPTSMPRQRKRKGPTLADSSSVSPYASAPTLKEYIWNELTDILQMHTTVPLSDKDIFGPAMKKFRWVVHCLLALLSVMQFSGPEYGQIGSTPSALWICWKLLHVLVRQ
jgi:hypothetical protein